MPPYPEGLELERSIETLRTLPPLVTSWEVERLRWLVAEAQQGKRFLLQGGDCAESRADCRAETITNKLKVLLQMSLVLVHGLKKPVIRVGRFAGQYAKPRSSTTETRTIDGTATSLPSYFGDLANDPEFTASARRADPSNLLRGYHHAAMTLNFIRALVDGGFADFHHPEYWDLSFARLSASRREEYERATRLVADGLRFMEALGERAIGEQTRAEFYTSHEALNLFYDSAQTRRVPRREGWFNLSTHMPWLGDRTRAPDGAHVEYLRGIRNPLGIKIGPSADPEEIVRLCRILNPMNEEGKVVLIPRLGARRIETKLPTLVRAVHHAGVAALWSCDPMHGNTTMTARGLKTRSFDDIRAELEASIDVHRALGSFLGGVHFELTGEDVTECTGGATGITEEQLGSNYTSACDPRLNYQQSLELAFILASKAQV